MVHQALSDQRRRLALNYVREYRTISLADLADLIAEAEADENIRHIPGDVIKETYISLYHIHVPLLEDANLVQYDQEDDLVTTADELDSILEHAGEQLLKLKSAASHETTR